MQTVLRKPVITEKATKLAEINKFVVLVDQKATKGQIKEELQRRFKVNILSVHTIPVRGKFRRKMGPVGGFQANRKKAIVSLKPGQKINWEEVA